MQNDYYSVLPVINPKAERFPSRNTIRALRLSQRQTVEWLTKLTSKYNQLTIKKIMDPIRRNYEKEYNDYMRKNERIHYIKDEH